MADDTIVVTKQPNLNAGTLDTTYELEPSNRAITVVNGINLWVAGRYIFIVVILSFLGFNIFATLGNVTDYVEGILSPIVSLFGFGVGETIKQTVNVSAKGAKTGINVAAGTVDNAVTLLEKSVGVKDVQFNRIDKKSISTEKAINTAMTKKSEITVPEPDDATSSTQQFRKGKSGFCYIGEDRGFRSCIKIGEGDKCISGDIFPTNDICINPNLRE